MIVSSNICEKIKQWHLWCKTCFLPSNERRNYFDVWLFCRETDELIAVIEYLETKSVVNPKEIALAKREEMKKKGEIKSPGKKKGRKSV